MMIIHIGPTVLAADHLPNRVKAPSIGRHIDPLLNAVVVLTTTGQSPTFLNMLREYPQGSARVGRRAPRVVISLRGCA